LSIRENRYGILDKIRPANVLVSVFDKNGLEGLVEGLAGLNPSVMFYSTGGTGKKIAEILGDRAGDNYTSVEEFTGAPEMEGGLVKTLHPKIHAGLLGERGNPAHEDYLDNVLSGMGGKKGVYFDIFVGNLYPFNEAIGRPDATAETARVNIDIGGPTMTMAAAKNWPSVAVLTSSEQYRPFLDELKNNGGMITARQRFMLAQEAFRAIGKYRSSIADYFEGIDYEKDVLPVLNIS